MFLVIYILMLFVMNHIDQIDKIFALMHRRLGNFKLQKLSNQKFFSKVKVHTGIISFSSIFEKEK